MRRRGRPLKETNFVLGEASVLISDLKLLILDGTESFRSLMFSYSPPAPLGFNSLNN